MPTSPERVTLAQSQAVIYRIVGHVIQKTRVAPDSIPTHAEIDTWVATHRAVKGKCTQINDQDTAQVVATAAYSGLKPSATIEEAEIAIALLERFLCGTNQLLHSQVDQLELEQTA